MQKLLRSEAIALFPEANPLRVNLFTASGWTSHGIYRASFHAIWPELVVDCARHGTV